jgi:hypothetical protein
MIFVHDKGRMANNILQYGHVYAWGREHGRKTVSMRFSYKYPWFHICHTPYHHFLTYVFAKYAAKWGLIATVRFDEEKSDYSREEQQILERKMVLVGGWQAHWYDLFLKYKPEILQLFAFDEKVRSKVEGIVGEYPADSLRLGVHIRRGDYCRWHGGKYFFTDDQYLSVIRQFLSLHPERKTVIFICGNDPMLDQEKYRQELKGHTVVFPAGNPAEDMCLLSECHYLVGAPSTFTLVASMYHDAPLYWIKDASARLSERSFDVFDNLFRHIL